MSSPGLGVMIGYLGGNEETVKANMAAMNKRIADITVKDDTLTLKFTDGSLLQAVDGGQSCCEHRYMVCDDKLSDYVGATYTGMEIRDAPDVDDGGEVHEVQFLYVHTSIGSFSVANHNEHNGYYGGFWITLDYTNGDDQ